MLRLDFSFDKEFADLYNRFSSTEKGKSYLKIMGIRRCNLDITELSKAYFGDMDEDRTIDVNANVGSKTRTPNNYLGEICKGITKLNGIYLLWKTIKTNSNVEEADRIISNLIKGDYYFHDLSAGSVMIPYCFAWASNNVLSTGRPYGQLQSKPPKRSDSFIAVVIESIFDLSQEQMGAIAIPDFLINLAYFYNKEGLDLDKKEIKHKVINDLQRVIHSLNQQYRLSNQSAFTNFSLFDRPNLINTFKDFRYPDGTKPEDILEYIMKLQEYYIEFISEKDPTTGLPYRFPVNTLNIYITEDFKIEDEKFLDLVCKYNKEGVFNIFICRGLAKLASCCFYGEQDVLIRSNKNVNLIKIKDIENLDRMTYFKNKLSIYHNGNWVKGDFIKIKKENRKLYKITTINNKELIISEDHLNPTLNGDKKTYELTVHDYLQTNNSVLSQFRDLNQNLTYAQGVMVGAYLGDGSNLFYNSAQTSFSLNKEKYEKLLPLFIQALDDWGLEKTSISCGKPYNNVYPVVLNNYKLKEFLKLWVYGNYCYEKEVNIDCLLQTPDFRKGIIDGFYITDGGNSNRMYSTSFNLIKQFEIILSSLGVNSIINESDRTDEKVIIRNEEFNRNYILYCIRWYENISEKRKGSSSEGSIWIKKNNSIYVKIKNIEEFENNEEFIYCFEMANKDEPYFTLPNNIITHNCRLISDPVKLREYGRFDSFANAGLSLGSARVVTVNFARIGKLAKADKDMFYNILEEKMIDTRYLLLSQRKIMEKKISEGFLKFFNIGWMHMNMFFSTFGMNGLYECMQFMGYDIRTEEGIEFAKEIFKFVENKLDLFSKEDKVPYNFEQVPAEGSSCTLARMDKLFFGDDYPYEIYANQFIPLWIGSDIIERAKIDGHLCQHMTGGSICHLNIGGEASEKQMRSLIDLAISSGLEHFALNPNFNVCEDGHITLGASTQNKCSKCGKEIKESYTRVVGYFTKVSDWDKTRRNLDFPNRVFNYL
jgi:anaerobic ribonucleoside-triphosphate reductase